METLQEIVLQRLLDGPRKTTSDLLKMKLSDAGYAIPESAVERFIEHTFAGVDGPFDWGVPEPDIELSAEDEAVLDEAAEGGLARSSEVVTKVIAASTNGILKSLKKDWKKERRRIEKEHRSFQKRLDKRWGRPLALMGMLLELAFEVGAGASEQTEGKPVDSREAVLIYLQARACQVYGEILILLQNGFADGAFARWRTLHEIAVVATFIEQHGDQVAMRYAAHHIVERRASMRAFEACREALGHEPIEPDEREAVEAAYQAAISQYGPTFGNGYGWAAEALKVSDPNFGQLQSAIGRSLMRSHYKLASFNVHAGAHAAFSRLSMLPGDPTVATGASNAGLDEPAQNAALSLVQASLPLLRVCATVDQLVFLKVMHALSSEIGPSVVAVAKQLKQDHFRKLRRA